MAKKNKVGKFIEVLATIAIIGGTSVFGAGCFQNNNAGTPPQPQVQQLETPNNFAFDEEHYVLTWDDVENAESYTICYNGDNINVDKDETSHTVLIAEEENTFKIKANGDGVNYSDSNWSDTITYTIDNTQELSLFEKVNIELNRAATSKGYTLERVIGVSYAESVSVGSNTIEFSVIGNKNNQKHDLTLMYYIEPGTSYEDLIYKVNESCEVDVVQKNLVSYNSAKIFVEKERYDGEMQNLKNQGYEISIVDSCVREGKNVGTKFRFEIVGTYKATLGSNVKYFTSVNQIDVLNPENDPIYDYEKSLRFEGWATITEKQFVMHEAGATLDYMANIIAQKEGA